MVRQSDDATIEINDRSYEIPSALHSRPTVTIHSSTAGVTATSTATTAIAAAPSSRSKQARTSGVHDTQNQTNRHDPRSKSIERSPSPFEFGGTNDGEFFFLLCWGFTRDGVWDGMKFGEDD